MSNSVASTINSTTSHGLPLPPISHNSQTTSWKITLTENWFTFFYISSPSSKSSFSFYQFGPTFNLAL